MSSSDWFCAPWWWRIGGGSGCWSISLCSSFISRVLIGIKWAINRDPLMKRRRNKLLDLQLQFQLLLGHLNVLLCHLALECSVDEERVIKQLYSSDLLSPYLMQVTCFIFSSDIVANCFFRWLVKKEKAIETHPVHNLLQLNLRHSIFIVFLFLFGLQLNLQISNFSL